MLFPVQRLPRLRPASTVKSTIPVRERCLREPEGGLTCPAEVLLLRRLGCKGCVRMRMSMSAGDNAMMIMTREKRGEPLLL